MSALGRLILRTIGRNLLIVGVFASTAIVAAVMLPQPSYSDGRTPPAPSKTRAERLIERHDCWIGAAPADVEIPGHVIWQRPNERAVYSARLVGPALDTIFADGNLPGRALAFCR